MDLRLFLGVVVLAACVTPSQQPPAAESTPSSESSARLPDQSKRVAPELLALYEGSAGDEATGSGTAAAATIALPITVRDDRVLVDCTADGNPEALAVALTELGMTEMAVFKLVISGWLPIKAIGRLEEIESLRLARGSAAQTRSTTRISPRKIDRSIKENQ